MVLVKDIVITSSLSLAMVLLVSPAEGSVWPFKPPNEKIRRIIDSIEGTADLPPVGPKSKIRCYFPRVIHFASTHDGLLDSDDGGQETTDATNTSQFLTLQSTDLHKDDCDPSANREKRSSDASIFTSTQDITFLYKLESAFFNENYLGPNVSGSNLDGILSDFEQICPEQPNPVQACSKQSDSEQELCSLLDKTNLNEEYSVSSTSRSELVKRNRRISDQKLKRKRFVKNYLQISAISRKKWQHEVTRKKYDSHTYRKRSLGQKSRPRRIDNAQHLSGREKNTA